MFSYFHSDAWIWDTVTAVLLLGSAGLSYLMSALQKNLQRSAKRVFLRIVGVFSAATFFIVFYGSFIEPRIIVVNEHELTIPFEQLQEGGQGTEELRVALISDLHVGPYKGERFLRRVVQKINALDPDIVLIPGDFGYVSFEQLGKLAPLADLETQYGVFASLGNHSWNYGKRFFVLRTEEKDHSLPVQRALERLNITVLRNDWREVQLADDSIFIAGVDDPYSNKMDIRSALPEIRQGKPIILLSHSPDVLLKTESRRPHIIVSGHTHGGQVRLPFIGAIAPIPTEAGQQYDQGLFPIDDDTTMVITRGVGETGPRARLFAPPEIVLLRLTPST